MAALDTVVRYLDAELRTSEVPDYDAALNGLQLTNASESVTRVAAAVDFSVDTVAAAGRERANLLLVHHGMFWRGPHRFAGPSFHRLRSAINGDLAVYASHIPLDLHPTFGNNPLLAKALKLESDGAFGRYGGVEIGVSGNCDLPTSVIADRARAFSAGFNTTAVVTPFAADRKTRRWAIITGAGASGDTLDEAREKAIDTFIVGEGAHHTAVQALELGIVVIYAGHYATETLGVRALAAHLGDHFDVSHVFVNVPTGL